VVSRILLSYKFFGRIILLDEKLFRVIHIMAFSTML